MGLKEYWKKRDLKKTKEPKGNIKKNSKTQNHFVIQKHDASHLHYDLRIAIDGVYKSWAIPKGPSLNPKHKRLAIHVEDHPLEYGKFEGVIPKGEYGAGTVMVWDRGLFKNMQKMSMSQSYAQGKIKIFLKGKKMQGTFALAKMKGSKKQWLLMKLKDAYADTKHDPVKTEQKSVKSGKTLEEIRKKYEAK